MRNRARCLSCLDVIESHHRHDFVGCGCGAIYIDGGTDYWRAGGKLEAFERIEGDD
jgi:hypothetical protein